MPDVHGRDAVLIVDVDSARLERLERHARAAGLVVSTASCFAAARQEIRNAPPDVLVSALPLAAYNGLHLAIVARQHHPDCAAVIFSQEAGEGSASDAESVKVALVRPDHLLDPKFWQELSTRDLDAALAYDPLRATA
jgi:ActR/RegA family two-component response regulator